jgi:hypothetical protein
MLVAGSLGTAHNNVLVVQIAAIWQACVPCSLRNPLETASAVMDWHEGLYACVGRLRQQLVSDEPDQQVSTFEAVAQVCAK